MNVDSLTPSNRALLLQALPEGGLVNVLYDRGTRSEGGFARERRCFALGERGWLEFLGWDGAPSASSDCRSRWALTPKAQVLLNGAA